ncbi:hypothetical protein BAE44_0013063 [Dichanthelium oligosanthes]|uniref:Uncharacterized protein n=1 Tax=Dichanthelium oligosanthes TaxID=888268 RepID=A0A1E5VLA9_9POAL|nr:hypothetical protein BAE44_0013063 [Dichanthelium oligosanthes]
MEVNKQLVVLVRHEYYDNLYNLTLKKSIQVACGKMNGKFLLDKIKIGCETATKSCELPHALPDTELHNPLGTISTSSQAEGPDSENSVTNYFDLEALILDQDLIPWDQEFDFIQNLKKYETLQLLQKLWDDTVREHCMHGDRSAQYEMEIQTILTERDMTPKAMSILKKYENSWNMMEAAYPTCSKKGCQPMNIKRKKLKEAILLPNKCQARNLI